MQYGRREIYTDYAEITSENVIEVLRDAMLVHSGNAADCDTLLRFEKGQQPKVRRKQYRKDIDNWCVDNLANEVTSFWISFGWGNPITLVQRGEKDSGGDSEVSAISLLNEFYDAENIKQKTQSLARYVEICGLGYTLVEINAEWSEGCDEAPFTINVLDPRFAFVVRSTRYADRRVLMGVTFRRDKKGNTYFTCYTKARRFEVLNLAKIIDGKQTAEADRWRQTNLSGIENSIGRVNIVEWVRDDDRMGVFERQMSEMQNLNLLISDFTNDVEQNCQAIWHGNDVEFPKVTTTSADGTTTEEIRKPETNEWVLTYTPENGRQPFIKALAIDYDFTSMLNQIIYRTERIKEKCNVPSRNDNSGGSTGTAMDSATGWTRAEVEASRQDQIKDGCKMEEVRCVLAAIKNNANYNSEEARLFDNIRAMDVKPNIKRQKNYELTTKINAFATGVSHGLAPEHMIPTINLFDDPNQVIADSEPYMERYLKSIYEGNASQTANTDIAPNADRLEQDKSDQIANSPFIDSDRTSN